MLRSMKDLHEIGFSRRTACDWQLGWVVDGPGGAVLPLGFLLGAGFVERLETVSVWGHRFGHSRLPLMPTNSAWSPTPKNLPLLFVSKPSLGECTTQQSVSSKLSKNSYHREINCERRRATVEDKTQSVKFDICNIYIRFYIAHQFSPSMYSRICRI